jgi:hypothetical protein
MERAFMNMLSKESFLELEKDLKAKGGFSVKALTSLGYEPFKMKIGYLVSVKKYEDKMSLEDFTYERVNAYLNKEGIEESIEPLIFGAWLNKEEGLVYLDMNSLKFNFNDAFRKAVKESQKAFYDLKNEKSIYLKDISAMEFLSYE